MLVELKKKEEKHTRSKHIASRAPAAAASFLWCDGGGGDDVATSLGWTLLVVRHCRCHCGVGQFCRYGGGGRRWTLLAVCHCHCRCGVGCHSSW